MTILVLDIGSSSVRALLFDNDAQPIAGAAASQPHQITTMPPGASTLEAALLRERVEACIDMVLVHPAASDIQVVAAATLVGNMLGVSAAGEPVTPIYTYADMRSAEDVAHLRTLVDPASIHQRTGCIIHTAYQPGRLAWLRRTEPELFASVSQWVDIGAYLYQCWFGGSYVTSHSVASWTGMLTRADLTWNRTWLSALSLTENALPELADYADIRRGLTADYAQRWPALHDVPFCLPVGDGAAANIGGGCSNETQIALTVGTTAALRVVSTDILPAVPPGLWGYRVDETHHLIGGATSEGGNIFSWAKETLRLDAADIDEALLNRAPDSHGLTFLPLLAGERSPGWATDATGSINGLRLSTTPLDILQAALEGVALRLALIAEQLAPLAQSDAPVIAGGGALMASSAWAHIIANALNRPLHLTAEPEITARGAALLALRAIGQGTWTTPPTIAYTIEPIPSVADTLRAARERQTAWYERVVEV